MIDYLDSTIPFRQRLADEWDHMHACLGKERAITRLADAFNVSEQTITDALRKINYARKATA